MSNLSRRSIVASAAALPALAVPVVAPRIATYPVYEAVEEAIETHRRLDIEWRACVSREIALEEELSNEDPRVLEAQQANTTTGDRADSAAYVLSDIEPTTVAGVLALLKYFAEASVADGGYGSSFPDILSDEADPAVSKRWGAL